MDLNKLAKQIITERKMKTVERLAGTLKIKNYSLVDHSYFVALLFQAFAEIEKIEYSVQDFTYILRHDLLESLTSDLIFPVKNFSQETKNAWRKIEQEIWEKEKDSHNCLFTDKQLKELLPPFVYSLFKDCDLLELLLFCYEEMQLGNRSKNILYIAETLIEFLEKSNFSSIRSFIENIKNNGMEI